MSSTVDIAVKTDRRVNQPDVPKIQKLGQLQVSLLRQNSRLRYITDCTETPRIHQW